MIKLLVVDDELGICDILKRTLAPIGFTVFIATNGSDAISIVKKEKPKVVFLDIRMLGISGIQVLQEIKKIDSAIKVIMVTVMDDAKTRNEALAAGADDFITKPFISEQLEDALGKQIGGLVG